MPISHSHTHSVRKRWMWAVVDGFIWGVSLAAALWLRYDFTWSHLRDWALPWFMLAALALQVGIGMVLGPYRRGHQWGSFEETLDVARTVGIVGFLLTAGNLLMRSPLPRSVPLMALVLALSGMFALRFVKRTWDTRRAVGHDADRRAIILGAGEAGRRLARSMLRDVNSGYVPVAFLDDDQIGRAHV